MAVIKEDTVVTAVEGLTIADLNGEAVVLDMHSGKYYGLNEVGARVLQLIEEPRLVREIITVMLQEFEVETDRMRDDLLAFLREMEGNKLIHVKEEAAA